MFTSNGLMCLSGVTICRMFLSAIARLPSFRRSLFVCVDRGRDFGAAIEPLAYADVQTLAAAMSARDAHQTIGLNLRCRECEPGRPPRALPDAMRAFPREQIETGRDLRAGEAAPTLSGSEIIAKPLLQLRNRRAELRKIMLGERRQRLHHDETTEMRDSLCRELRQRREGLDLVASMRTLARRIEQHQHAPLCRKREARDDRRDTCCRTATTVDDEAAVAKQPDAKPGAGTAPQPDRIGRDVERHSWQ